MSLSDLAPVYLDELNATAELMSRVDRKYPLHERTAEAILDSLPTGTRVLDIEGRTEFSYTSIYFDTTARDSYLMAARGRPHRFKVRVRNYQDSGEAFLEVKTRRGGNTIKERTTLQHCSRSRPNSTASSMTALPPEEFAASSRSS